MTSERALWRRVDEALDARRDPYADSGLARDLGAAPEVDAAVRRLTRGLSLLSADGGERGSTPAPLPAARWIAAAAAAFAILVTLTARSGPEDPMGLEPSVASPFDGVEIYESRIDVERVQPPVPRAARVVHLPERIVTWQVAGRSRP